MRVQGNAVTVNHATRLGYVFQEEAMIILCYLAFQQRGANRLKKANIELEKNQERYNDQFRSWRVLSG